MNGMQLPRSKLYILAFILFLAALGFHAYMIYELWWSFMVSVFENEGWFIWFLTFHTFILAPLEGIGLGYFVKFKAPAYKSFEKGIQDGLVTRSAAPITKLGS